MGRFVFACCCVFMLFLVSASFAAVVRPEVKPPPASVFGLVPAAGPVVLSSGGDTAWLQVRSSGS